MKINDFSFPLENNNNVILDAGHNSIPITTEGRIIEKKIFNLKAGEENTEGFINLDINPNDNGTCEFPTLENDKSNLSRRLDEYLGVNSIYNGVGNNYYNYPYIYSHINNYNYDIIIIILVIGLLCLYIY